MTEKTDPSNVVAGYDKPDSQEDWLVMKMFLRSVSNAGGADVDDVSKIIPVLRAMSNVGGFNHKKRPMTLSIHAERKYDFSGVRLNFLERERVAIERDIPYLLQEVPEAHIIICHVSDAFTIEVIRHYRKKGYNIWGEICPHYTIWTCDDLFEGPGDKTMLNTHLFCLPIFKTEADRRAILEAMLSGEDCWIFGTDEACHLDNPTKSEGVKINSKGFVVGGQTQIPQATVSYVIEKAVEAGRIDILPGFLSHNGREALGLPKSTTEITFRQKDWVVQDVLTRHSRRLGSMTARVAMGGQTRKYLPLFSNSV
jgi:dihydroorotase